jgi:hypothetical protein
MSTLYISHGDKGGVGKSMVSTALIEWLLDAGCKRLALVEGDPSQPDLEKRYAEVDQILTGYLPLNRPGKAAGDAVTALATWIEENSPDAVVVNLPGGAGETLDSLGGVIRAVCDVLGMRMVALYSLGVTDALTAGMVGSLSGGLLSHVDPDNRAAVYPLFSAPRSAFLWSRSDQRKIYPIRQERLPLGASRPARRPHQHQALARQGAERPHPHHDYRSMTHGQDLPDTTRSSLMDDGSRPARQTVSEGI